MGFGISDTALMVNLDDDIGIQACKIHRAARSNFGSRASMQRKNLSRLANWNA